MQPVWRLITPSIIALSFLSHALVASRELLGAVESRNIAFYISGNHVGVGSAVVRVESDRRIERVREAVSQIVRRVLGRQ
jgi:hypothetical protein